MLSSSSHVLAKFSVSFIWINEFHVHSMFEMMLLQVAGVRSTTEGGRVLCKLCGGRTYCERVLSAGEWVCQSVSRWVSQSVSRWVSVSVCQQVSESVSWCCHKFTCTGIIDVAVMGHVRGLHGPGPPLMCCSSETVQHMCELKCAPWSKIVFKTDGPGRARH